MPVNEQYTLRDRIPQMQTAVLRANQFAIPKPGLQTILYSMSTKFPRLGVPIERERQKVAHSLNAIGLEIADRFTLTPYARLLFGDAFVNGVQIAHTRIRYQPDNEKQVAEIIRSEIMGKKQELMQISSFIVQQFNQTKPPDDFTHTVSEVAPEHTPQLISLMQKYIIPYPDYTDAETAMQDYDKLGKLTALTQQDFFTWMDTTFDAGLLIGELLVRQPIDATEMEQRMTEQMENIHEIRHTLQTNGLIPMHIGFYDFMARVEDRLAELFIERRTLQSRRAR